jgi:hypothetical protein
MQSSIVNNEGSEIITVFLDGEIIGPVFQDHPNFTKIKQQVLDKNPFGLRDLFDVSFAVAEKFQQLSERVSVAHGKILLDGDPVDNALSRQAIRLLDEENEDWRGLVKFYENCEANPNKHSAEQLYEWLAGRPFTITDDGCFIGYKGLTNDYHSLFSGKARVDGTLVTGRIPNEPGVNKVIEMPRSEVAFNPSEGCSIGLHVGTHDFAQQYGHGVIISMKVNPRDVVSVPTDCSAEKMRVCKYEVVDTVKGPYDEALLEGFYDEDDCDCNW